MGTQQNNDGVIDGQELSGEISEQQKIEVRTAHQEQQSTAEARVAGLAQHTGNALKLLKEHLEKLDAETLELRSDLAGLDARVAGLESSVSTLTQHLNMALAIMSEMNSDTTILQALEAQLNAFTLKVRAAFEHLGTNIDNLSGRSRRF